MYNRQTSHIIVELFFAIFDYIWNLQAGSFRYLERRSCILVFSYPSYMLMWACRERRAALWQILPLCSIPQVPVICRQPRSSSQDQLGLTERLLTKNPFSENAHPNLSKLDSLPSNVLSNSQLHRLKLESGIESLEMDMKSAHSSDRVFPRKLQARLPQWRGCIWFTGFTSQIILECCTIQCGHKHLLVFKLLVRRAPEVLF